MSSIPSEGGTITRPHDKEKALPRFEGGDHDDGRRRRRSYDSDDDVDDDAKGGGGGGGGIREERAQAEETEGEDKKGGMREETISAEDLRRVAAAAADEDDERERKPGTGRRMRPPPRGDGRIQSEGSSSPPQSPTADASSSSSSSSPPPSIAFRTPAAPSSSSGKSRPSTPSSSSLVVCGVDGTVYTLDAYTGRLRGMFASGPAIVSSSSSFDGGPAPVDDDDDDDDDEDEGDNDYYDEDDYDGEEGEGDSGDQSRVGKDRRSDELDLDNRDPPSPPRRRRRKSERGRQRRNRPRLKERVVPGLDGHLYSLREIAASPSSFSDAVASFHGGETYHVEPLPVNVQNVVDSPVSTCRPVEGEGEGEGESEGKGGSRQRCGVVLGSKKTTIYAVDPATGKVRWVQDPHGGGGAKGFTTNPPGETRGGATRPPRGAKKSHPGRVVLLQREDYSVRHVDAEEGEEVWRVELGQFSALDFDVNAYRRRGEGGGDDGDEVVGGDGTGTSTGTGRGSCPSSTEQQQQPSPRGVAAAAALASLKEHRKTVPPLLERRKNPTSSSAARGGGGEECPSESNGGDRFSDGGGANRGRGDTFAQHEDDFDRDHSRFREFPSVAIGEDQTSIMAVDAISGELLWKRRIDSVVASVYGVGKESSWVDLDFIDEAQMFGRGGGGGGGSPHTYDYRHHRAGGPRPGGFLPLSGEESAAAPDDDNVFVPDDAVRSDAGHLHRLGRHHSNVFVSTTYEPSSTPEMEGQDYGFRYEPMDNFPPGLTLQVDGEDYYPDAAPIPPWPSRLFAGRYDTTPLSHKTEHGLFLTWSMISTIVGLLALGAAGVRVIYLRQKRKWENTPVLAPLAAPPNGVSDDWTILRERSGSHSSGGMYLPPIADNPFQSLSDSNAPSFNKKPPARSLSLGAIVLQSNATQPFLSEKGETTLPPLDGFAARLATAPCTANPGIATHDSPPSVMETNGTATMALQTLLTAKSADDDAAQRRQAMVAPGIDNIDGIPLVRYSRYRSEFKELSPLGKGGFGTVFRCNNALDSREYAIKKIRIRSHLRWDGSATKHFSQKLHRVLREVKILALLDHPNIVRYYTAWLEVDDGIRDGDDEANSTFDKITPSGASGSIFSGFGSNSRDLLSSFLPSKSGSDVAQQHRSPAKTAKGLLGGYATRGNPLGWNNFGSFRLDESKSEESSSFGLSMGNTRGFDVRGEKARFKPPSDDEDLGFTWERSDENTTESSFNGKEEISMQSKGSEDDIEEGKSQSGSAINSADSDGSSEEEKDESNKSAPNLDNSVNKSPGPAKEDPVNQEGQLDVQVRHILFIQMQLCSIRTLEDFLRNRRARSGSLSSSPSLLEEDSYNVDVPFALRLFGQIANGVKYVHEQGLIHRDLKPQNCFIDDGGNVKVGDFGLSRESAAAAGLMDSDDDGDHPLLEEKLMLGGEAENTAGVGTRAYASPEQLRGSNYDASTDVYSLGIILFELCYPMYTAMEKYTEFGGIRKGEFPAYWNSKVKTVFPTLHHLLAQMISFTPSERPSAACVADRIDALLGEYSVRSLDKTWRRKGALLLRVETDEAEGVLAKAKMLIKDAAPHAKILQYGLRGQASKAIMEFALEISAKQETESIREIFSRLHEDNMTVRQIH